YQSLARADLAGPQGGGSRCTRLVSARPAAMPSWPLRRKPSTCGRSRAMSLQAGGRTASQSAKLAPSRAAPAPARLRKGRTADRTGAVAASRSGRGAGGLPPTVLKAPRIDLLLVLLAVGARSRGAQAARGR